MEPTQQEALVRRFLLSLAVSGFTVFAIDSAIARGAPCIYLNHDYHQFSAPDFPHRLCRYRQTIYWAVAVVAATAMLLPKGAKVRRSFGN